MVVLAHKNNVASHEDMIMKLHLSHHFAVGAKLNVVPNANARTLKRGALHNADKTLVLYFAMVFAMEDKP